MSDKEKVVQYTDIRDIPDDLLDQDERDIKAEKARRARILWESEKPWFCPGCGYHVSRLESESIADTGCPGCGRHGEFPERSSMLEVKNNE